MQCSFLWGFAIVFKTGLLSLFSSNGHELLSGNFITVLKEPTDGHWSRRGDLWVRIQLKTCGENTTSS